MLAKIFKLPFLRHARHAGTCGPASIIREAPTQITTLENGIRIATQETYEELGAATLMIETGPRFEKPDNNGINSFIEHLAYKGFKSMNRCLLEQKVLFAGMKLTVKTTQELQWFQAVCPSHCLPMALCILCKLVSDPLFNPSELNCELISMNLELHDTDTNTRKLVFENLFRTAFQGTPLALPVIGPSENVRNFTSDMAVKYAKEHYEPWRLVFAVSGKICHLNVVADIATYLGKMPVCSIESAYQPSRFTGSEMTYRDDSMPFAHVCIAFEAPGINSQKYLYLRILKNLFGAWDRTLGVGGPHPELAKRCADTSLCLSYECFYLPFSDVGLFGVYFVSEKNDVEDMIYNCQEVWKRMCTTTFPIELLEAKQWTLFEMCKERTGAANASLDIAKDVMYFGERRHMTRLVESIHGINECVKVCEAAVDLLYDRSPAVAAVGPTEALVEYSRMISGMYWLRW